jgi:hypothetical protein
MLINVQFLKMIYEYICRNSTTSEGASVSTVTKLDAVIKFMKKIGKEYARKKCNKGQT